MSDMRGDEIRQADTDMRTDEERRTDADMRMEEEMRTDKELRDNRRMADRRQRDAEAMRTNPEVMGRAEPVAIDDRDRQVNEPSPIGRVGGPGEVRTTNGGMNLWPDMTDFHGRFEQIQSEFIEDPKSAVTKAEKLMEEMLDHMMRSMHERMQSMHRDIESEKTDTEQLRLTMRGYKEFINSLAHREAA
jgi:membrane-bound ClpP family serine protease